AECSVREAKSSFARRAFTFGAPSRIVPRMIEFENVSKRFPGQSLPAVDSISLSIQADALHVLLGKSGCGKTTTLKMINRLVDATSGRITWDGTDIRSLDPIDLRRRIGYAFQGIGLFPHMSVAQNIAVVPRLLGWREADIVTRVNELLVTVGLNPSDYADRLPGELFGGQQQRVGVARALAARSKVLLMDEPFAALDPITRDELQTELRSLQRQLGLTIVLVTHDVTEALLLADRIAVMKDGVLLAHDTPDALVSNPPHEYIRELMEMPRRQATRVAQLAGAYHD
ncbi:MAG TPA: ABC transporter ATP-binding protein, partial [Gammaproteobacteria bacterium]|nr:ABC transporter ATP-binding protein [Gammaproteobacteria bacterium]